ncbi:MAG: DEAD/DEAH box helicase [Rhodospirillales bacterium]
MTKFEGLGLNQPILRAIAENGYAQPTPIQSQTIPALLDGNDLLGIAQTGTGKTAAFALPVLDRLSRRNQKAESRRPRALILAPTRELVVQINESIKTYGRHAHQRVTPIFGGVSIRAQIVQMNKGAHIVVATPGRLLDLMNQGYVDLSGVEMFVLDEADRMLDMGFQRDVAKITAKLPNGLQTALFSATMPSSVAKLANDLLDNPVRVEVTPQATTVERIAQEILFVPKDKKRALLGDLMADGKLSRVLVFTRTKHGADKVARHLQNIGVACDAIHGNKSQNARQRALNGFKSGALRALVATDIAARGIDVDGVTHVINFELPNEPDSYVHRIGRTARAGTSGAAISFCEPDERAYLAAIERTIRQQVPINTNHAHHVEGAELRAVDGGTPGRGVKNSMGKRKQNQRRRARRRDNWQNDRAA